MVKQISLILLIILLQTTIALILQWASDYSNEILTLILILALVIGLNGGRFVIWGVLHRKYDLSKTYPLISLFFPFIYAIALYQNEAALTWNKILGLVFVFIGVFTLTRENAG